MIDAVIVSWNAAGRIGTLVASLRADPGVARVTVVDNASADATASEARSNGAEVLALTKNFGYAAAANAGAKLGASPFVAILNDDVRFDRGRLSTLSGAFDDDAIAIVGPRLITSNGKLEPSTHGAPMPEKILLQRLPRLKPFARAAAAAYAAAVSASPGTGLAASAWRHDRRADVEEVCGACLLLRRTAWKNLGGFDDAFPFGSEDADLCARARAEGLRVVFDPRLDVTHLGGLGRRSNSVQAVQWRAEGWRIYAQKHFGIFRRVLTTIATMGI